MRAPERPPGRAGGIGGLLVRGTAFQLAGRVWSSVCTLWIMNLAARALDDAGFGRFTFYISLFLWLDTLVVLGTAEVAVQRTASDPAAVPAVLAGTRRIRVAMGLVGVLAVAAASFGFGESGAAWIVLAACYPITHALEVSTLVWRNEISWGRPVAVRALAALASLCSVAALARAEVREPALYLVGVAAGSTLGNFLLHFVARPRLPRPPPRPDGAGPEREPAAARGLLRAAWPLGLSALCAQAYFYVDNFFVRGILGDEALGPYNTAVRVMSFLIMLAQYATLAALPWLARRAREGTLEPALAKLGPAVFAAGAALAGLCWPWTGRILELVVTGTGAAAESLRWLLLSSVAIHAGSVLLTAVVALQANGAKLWIQAGGLALNVALNAWAIPAHGIAGAGITKLATEAFVAVAAAVVLARRGIVPFRGARGLRWLAGPCLFAACAWISARLPLE